MNDVSGRRSRAGAYSVTNSAEQIATGTAMIRAMIAMRNVPSSADHTPNWPWPGCHVESREEAEPGLAATRSTRGWRGTGRSAPSARASGAPRAASDHAVRLVGPRPDVRGTDALLSSADARSRLCRATSLPTNLLLDYIDRVTILVDGQLVPVRGRAASTPGAFDSVEVAARWPLGERHRNNDRQVHDRTDRAAGPVLTTTVAPRRISA